MSKIGHPNTAPSSLDQLEAILNQILAQIGRLFDDAVKGNRVGAAANSSRLKQQLPRATIAFHDALDQMENELLVAKAVMRRDYAQLLARPDSTSEVVDRDAQMVDAPQPLPPPDDLTMDGSEIQHIQPSIEKSEIDLDRSQGTVDSQTIIESGNSVKDAIDLDTPLPAPKPTTHSPSANPQSQAPITAGLGPEPEANIPPDTTTTRAQHQSQDQETNNGDLSSLLPGLETYANLGALGTTTTLTGPSAATPPVVSTDSHQGTSQNVLGALESLGNVQDHQGATFDDLMDLGDFDMNAVAAVDANVDADSMKYDDTFFNLD